MIDFEIMERSLKIAWIKRITEARNVSWKIIPNQASSQYGGLEFLTKCDYDFKLLDLENLPEFYRTVLSYWQSFKPLTFNEHTPIKEYIIWNNRNIVLDGKPIFINSWHRKGICYIKDLLYKDHSFLSLTDMKERYNFEIPFTTYYGLLKAIPTEWKSELRTATNAHVTATHLKLLSTKTVYSTLLDKSFLVPTAETRILNYGFTKDNIRNIYMLAFRILKEPKLIMFQVKIIHNILPTQSSLYRAGTTNNETCPLCNLENQSLIHMLITCSVSSSFWNRFSNWWHEKLNQKLTLSESTILYGWHQKSNHWEVLNYSLIVAKYHIFATSVRNGTLDFECFRSRLNNKIAIRRANAAKTNRTFQFIKSFAKLL